MIKPLVATQKRENWKNINVLASLENYFICALGIQLFVKSNAVHISRFATGEYVDLP